MNHYTLVFNTANGTTRSMRINRPQVGLPLSDVQAAIAKMIANDIFDQSRGALESLNRMELSVVERTQIM
jgi:predicted aspartyl protease